MEFGDPDWYLVNCSITIASAISSALAALLTILVIRTRNWGYFQRKRLLSRLARVLGYCFVLLVSVFCFVFMVHELPIYLAKRFYPTDEYLSYIGLHVNPSAIYKLAPLITMLAIIILIAKRNGSNKYAATA